MSDNHYIRRPDGKFAGSTAGATPPQPAPRQVSAASPGAPVNVSARPVFPVDDADTRLEAAANALPERIELASSWSERLSDDDAQRLVSDPSGLDDDWRDDCESIRDELARDLALEAFATTASPGSWDEEEFEALVDEVRHRDESDPLMESASHTRIRVKWEDGSTATLFGSDLLRNAREGGGVTAWVSRGTALPAGSVHLSEEQVRAARFSGVREDEFGDRDIHE